MAGRRVAIAVVAVLGSAAVVASSGTSSGGSSGSGSGSSGETGGKVLQHSEDVKIVKCGHDSIGNLDAKVKVTNHSSKPSDYIITIAFESANGKNQITTGDAVVNSLQPGQSTVQDANGLQSYKKPFKCTLSDAQRTESTM